MRYPNWWAPTADFPANRYPQLCCIIGLLPLIFTNRFPRPREVNRKRTFWTMDAKSKLWLRWKADRRLIRSISLPPDRMINCTVLTVYIVSSIKKALESGKLD